MYAKDALKTILFFYTNISTSFAVGNFLKVEIFSKVYQNKSTEKNTQKSRKKPVEVTL